MACIVDLCGRNCCYHGRYGRHVFTSADCKRKGNMASAPETISSNLGKILIIRAGIAGLSAAGHLVKNCITDFKILEARNRIGGRIVSTNTGNHKIELGANWIHGILGNPMYLIAMVIGLIDIAHVPSPHKVVAATEEGKQIPFQVLQQPYDAYVCFFRRCEEYFLCHYSPPTGINSVGEHISLEAALNLDRSSNDAERHLRQPIFDCLLKRETCITGYHSMDEIDLLELGSYTELQGGNIVLPSGYSSILKPVSREILQGNVYNLSNTLYRKIYSFSKLSEMLLLGWISGREAKYMETLTHDQVADTRTDILRKFLSDPFIPKPKLCICTSWHKQPYTRGSYTAMAVGASHLDIEHIAQPLYANPQQDKVRVTILSSYIILHLQPVVLFAGEHTHSNFYSTVHGAYLTGRSAAQVLLSHQSPQELVMEYQGTSDLSSWIQGISLD
ncbi:hypothetical protein B7P43_G14571 [Cryptotermes secundus]|uniref:Amine oxidase domain-containing protein n=1 Tax=Cryptotermes secundus TaxID=105785 RepID=A0A2J7PIU3_9NEOP|nr:hypothetical protein B7P43_G14571 [Cryptotermes secundus]